MTRDEEGAFSRRDVWTRAWFVSGVTGAVSGVVYISGMTLSSHGIAMMWIWMVVAMIVAGVAGMILDHMVGMVEAAVAGMIVPMVLMASPEGAWPWLLPASVALVSAGMEGVHRAQTRGRGKAGN